MGKYFVQARELQRILRRETIIIPLEACDALVSEGKEFDKDTEEVARAVIDGDITITSVSTYFDGLGDGEQADIIASALGVSKEEADEIVERDPNEDLYKYLIPTLKAKEVTAIKGEIIDYCVSMGNNVIYIDVEEDILIFEY